MSPRPSPRLYPHPRTPPSPGSPIPSQRALRGAGKRPPGSGHRQQAPPRRRPSPLREAPPGLQPSPPLTPAPGGTRRRPGPCPRAPGGPRGLPPAPPPPHPSAPLPPPRSQGPRRLGPSASARARRNFRSPPPPQRPALGTGARPRGGAQGTLGDVVSRGGRGAAAMLGAGRLCVVSSAGAGLLWGAERGARRHAAAPSRRLLPQGSLRPRLAAGGRRAPRAARRLPPPGQRGGVAGRGGEGVGGRSCSGAWRVTGLGGLPKASVTFAPRCVDIQRCFGITSWDIVKIANRYVIWNFCVPRGLYPDCNSSFRMPWGWLQDKEKPL